MPAPRPLLSEPRDKSVVDTEAPPGCDRPHLRLDDVSGWVEFIFRFRLGLVTTGALGCVFVVGCCVWCLDRDRNLKPIPDAWACWEIKI